MNIRAPGSHTAQQIWLVGIALLVSYSTGVSSVPHNYTNYYCILHKREEGGRSTELFLVINVGMQWEGTGERLLHNYCIVSSSANVLYHPNRYPLSPSSLQNNTNQKNDSKQKTLRFNEEKVILWIYHVVQLLWGKIAGGRDICKWWSVACVLGEKSFEFSIKRGQTPIFCFFFTIKWCGFVIYIVTPNAESTVHVLLALK